MHKIAILEMDLLDIPATRERTSTVEEACSQPLNSSSSISSRVIGWPTSTLGGGGADTAGDRLQPAAQVPSSRTTKSDGSKDLPGVSDEVFPE